MTLANIFFLVNLGTNIMVDLGMIYDWFRDLARVLNVNVMAYDYTGYGLNSSDPSEQVLFFFLTILPRRTLAKRIDQLSDTEISRPVKKTKYGLLR